MANRVGKARTLNRVNKPSRVRVANRAGKVRALNKVNRLSRVRVAVEALAEAADQM